MSERDPLENSVGVAHEMFRQAKAAGYREAIEAAARVAEEVQRHFMQVEAEIPPASATRPVLSMQGMAAGKIARAIRALLPKDPVDDSTPR